VSERGRRWIGVALLCGVASGCLLSSPPITPSEALASSVRRVRVVPVESMPLVLEPADDADREAVAALAHQGSRAGTGAVPPAPGETETAIASTATTTAKFILTGFNLFVIVTAGEVIAESVAAGGETADDSPVLVKGEPHEFWTPTVDIARRAVELLHSTGRDAQLADAYLRLPVQARVITWDMEYWWKPLRRFYGTNPSTVDFSSLGLEPDEAVLEVGLLNHAYYRDRLVLQVFVRLIEMPTHRVVGRAREAPSAFATSGSLVPLLENDAAGLKRLIVETGNQLLYQCLADLRLN